MLTSSPRRYILWSASIAFILSYPFIYTSLSTGLPEVSILPHASTNHILPDLSVKQVYISPPHLSNSFFDDLVAALAPLSQLSANPPSSEIHAIPSLISPLSSLKHENNSLFISSATASQPANLQSILYLPKIASAELTSASGLLVSYLYQKPEQEKHWDDTLSSLISLKSQSSIETYSHIVSVKKACKPKSFFQLSFTVLPFCPIPIVGFTVTYSLLTSYVAISWEHVSSVRSKLGLFVAFVVQIFLSIAASISVISYFYPTFSGSSLRNFLIVPYLIVIVSLEGLIRLLNAVARTPVEDPPSLRLSTGFSKSISKTVMILGSYSGVLLLYAWLFPFVSPQIRQICLFAVLAIFINFCLHVTYFSSVLFIDLRRLEGEDFSATDVITTQTHSLFPLDSKMPRFIKNQYTYLHHLYLHPTLSASATVLTLTLVFLSIWGYITDPAEQYNYSANKAPFFLSSLLSTSLSKYNNIRVFEPIVLRSDYSSSQSIMFHIDSPVQSSFFSFIRMLSVPIVLEFFASLAFILSLTGVIFKFVLPPVKEQTEMTPSNEVMEFSSKELTGCHTLDVLMVASQGSTIATISMDHKVFVWNASSAPGAKIEHPIEISNPPDFWPISRVVLNSSMSLIAFFCTKLRAVKCFDYKSGVFLYHVHEASLFQTPPVEIFFSGSDLVLTTCNGTLASISMTGAMTTFPVEFSSKCRTLVHARQLVTPRIPERVVCISAENDISIGTHIGKVWKFRKLHIQELPMQINVHTHVVSHGMHDISKYKPYPIPAPQAMLSQRNMRTGKMGMMGAQLPTEKPKAMILSNPILAIVPVPAINMVLLATAVQACLFDAQTGIIVRNFQLGHFKTNSLRVFHSQPTHCRFCGCVSVDTLSIAYSDAETDGMVICHTLTIDNRAKNSICIRVERDPRETRCLGFDATTERQHWIEGVEGWDVTEINMLMGVRRKIPLYEEQDEEDEPEQDGPASTGSTLRRRRTNGRKQLHTPKPTNGAFPLISSTWEGFAMSAIGQISYYDIPDNAEHVHPDKTGRGYGLGGGTGLGGGGGIVTGKDIVFKRYFGGYGNGGIGLELDAVTRRRLLIQSIGPVAKYGAKSIAVAFGNILKVLYFGKEESFPASPTTGAPSMIAPYMPSPSPSVSGGKKWRREVGY